MTKVQGVVGYEITEIWYYKQSVIVDKRSQSYYRADTGFMTMINRIFRKFRAESLRLRTSPGKPCSKSCNHPRFASSSFFLLPSRCSPENASARKHREAARPGRRALRTRVANPGPRAIRANAGSIPTGEREIDATGEGLLEEPPGKGPLKKPPQAAGVRWFCRDNPPWLSFVKTGTEACPYGKQFDDRDSLPSSGGVFQQPRKGEVDLTHRGKRTERAFARHSGECRNPEPMREHRVQGIPPPISDRRMMDFLPLMPAWIQAYAGVTMFCFGADRSDRNHAPGCAIFLFPIPPPRRSRHDGN